MSSQTAFAVNPGCVSDPGATIALTLKQTTNGILLTWQNTGISAAFATGYFVYKSEGDAGTQKTSTILTGMNNEGGSWTDTAVIKGKTYNYQINAVQPAGSHSFCSDVASLKYEGMAEVTIPPNPTNFNAVSNGDAATEEERMKVTLTWDWEWKDMPSGAKVQYKVEKKLQSSLESSSWSDITPSGGLTEKKLDVMQSPKTTVIYRVTAVINGVSSDVTTAPTKEVVMSVYHEVLAGKCDKVAGSGVTKYINQAFCGLAVALLDFGDFLFKKALGFLKEVLGVS